MEAAENRTIAQNSLLLYLRMMVTIIVGLYTSRIILQVLGFSDYGLYNVIANFVVVLTFLNTSLSSSASRYIAIYTGKFGNKHSLSKKIFGNIISVHLCFSAFIVLLAETIGLWFVNNKLQIPTGRENAAFWVYQFSVFSSVLVILTTPYNAAIIAHEKMATFAYLTIFDCFAKLLIVFTLPHFEQDRLILYAILFLGLQIVDRFLYGIYCYRKIDCTRTIATFHKRTFIDLFKFIGWSAIGQLAAVGQVQGSSVILNLFFGTAINAAQGVAMQVQQVIKGFCVNFQMATNPQIYKKYASGDLNSMHKILFFCSRFSFCLLLVISMPFMFCSDVLLNIWLDDVPEYASTFLRIILVTSLFFSISNPLTVSIRATGNIKKYQLVEGIILLSALPFAYLWLKLWNGSPSIVLVLILAVEFLAMIARIYIALPQINLNIEQYLNQVIIPILKVCFMSFIVPIIIYFYSSHTITGTLSVVAISVISVIICSYYYGISFHEQVLLKEFLKRHIHL